MEKKKYNVINLDTSTPSIKDHVFFANFQENTNKINKPV